MNGILIGTSGYDHPELKGVFYPEDLPRKDFLLYYSTKFNAVEINSTFYGMPTPDRMLSFFARAEGRMKFSVKANRLLTHEPDKNWKENASLFRTAVYSLAQKGGLSTILFQFPQSFHYTKENRFYLADLLKEFEAFPKVVEFRHVEWIKQSVFEGLEARRAGIVFCDMPRLSALPDGNASRTPFIGQDAYIRFHGRNARGWYVSGDSSTDTPRYDYDYSEEELAAFVPVVKQAAAEGKKIQLYFNNHPKGTGIKNALMMKDLLSKNV